MKKIFLAILIFISVQSFGQNTLYAERLNVNGTTDQFFRKPFTDSVFNNSQVFVQFTKEHFDFMFEPVLPNQFGNFHKDADGIWRNFTPRSNYSQTSDTAINATKDFARKLKDSVQANVNLKANASAISNIDNTSDANKPVSSATQTALNLKQNISDNNGGWTTLRVTGSNATTTGQALTNITGLITTTLLNATLYEVEATLYVSTSAVTTGCQFAFTANGTGGAATVFINVSGTTTTNAATTVTQSASGTAVGTFLTTSSASGIIVMRGFILTRGSGTATIALQHLKVTSGTSTVLIGSKFQWRLAQ